MVQQITLEQMATMKKVTNALSKSLVLKCNLPIIVCDGKMKENASKMRVQV